MNVDLKKKAILCFVLTLLFSGHAFADGFTNTALLQGITKGSNGKFDDAIADFTKAIAQDPKDAEIYYDRARAYAFLIKYDKAIVDYNKAIELNPQYTYAYSFRCNAYLRLGDNDKAIKSCLMAITLEPRLAEAYSDLGLAYRNKGKLDLALSSLNRAIALKPYLSEAYINRAITYFKLNEYSKGVADIRVASMVVKKPDPKAPNGPKKGS